MAMTETERQRKYRESRPTSGDNGERRINTWVSTAASLALARLAQFHGVSKRQMLEKLIGDADDAIVEYIDPDSPAWNDYFDTPPRKDAKHATRPHPNAGGTRPAEP